MNAIYKDSILKFTGINVYLSLDVNLNKEFVYKRV